MCTDRKKITLFNSSGFSACIIQYATTIHLEIFYQGLLNELKLIMKFKFLFSQYSLLNANTSSNASSQDSRCVREFHTPGPFRKERDRCVNYRYYQVSWMLFNLPWSHPFIASSIRPSSCSQARPQRSVRPWSGRWRPGGDSPSCWKFQPWQRHRPLLQPEVHQVKGAWRRGLGENRRQWWSVSGMRVQGCLSPLGTTRLGKNKGKCASGVPSNPHRVLSRMYLGPYCR